MMTIAPIASSNGYYENNPEGNYYLNDELQSKFVGKGAEDLGINNKPVEKDVQDNLMIGILPTGETITRFDSRHRSGYDLTFSAPKSVSVLSLVTGDTRLIEAHKIAVEQTIGEIEKLASVRNKINGEYTITNTNNLVVALHTHDTSRELDPQLHTHALVFNLTKNEDGNWQSLSSDKLNKTGFIESVYINQIAFGSIYRGLLRNQVEEMGFKTVDIGKGLWEIEGVPIKEFSTRREQVIEAVGENATAKERSLATIETRKFKTFVNKENLHKDWNDRLEKEGFNKEDFYKNIDTSNKNIDTPKLVISTKDTFTENKNAVYEAINLLSETKAQLTYQDILNTSLSLSSKNQGVIDELKRNIDDAIEKNLITPIDKDKSVFVSSIGLEREKNIVELNNVINNKELNINNAYIGKDMGVYEFFNEKKNIGIISGKTNFSTQITRFNELNEGAKINQLKPLIIVNSEKVKSKYEEKNINNVISINQLNNTVFDEKTLIIVDGAERFPLKSIEQILSVAKDNQSPITLLNTKTQIGMGNSIELLKKNGVAEYQFTTKPDQVSVKVQSIADSNERYKQLVKDFVSEQKETGNAIIITNNNKEKKIITDITRNELKANNLLGQKEVEIDVLIPKFLSELEKSNIENYKKGMVLENKSKSGFSQYYISGSDKSRNLLYVNNGGKDEVINIKSINKNWSINELKTIKISINDKLKSVGFNPNKEIKIDQTLTVTSLEKNSFFVKDEKGNQHKLSLNEIYKLDYDYVKSQSSTLNDNKVVFTSLSHRSLNQNNLNQLLKTGSDIRLYSPLDQEQTEKKLGRIKNITLISEHLKGKEYSSVSEAIDGRKKELYTDVQKAVNTAIGIAQKSNVFFSVHKVVAEALETNHKLQINDILNEVESRIKNGTIHLMNYVDGQGQKIAVSDEIYQQEKKIQNIIINGIGSEKPLLLESQISKENLEHLTAGQKEATKNILTSTDRFIGIQGFAGVGKTTQLKSVLNELKANNSNIEIVGLAPTHKAVYELQSVGIKAQTISSFLVEAKQDINSNSNFSLENKLFLIDESSMIGNKNITNLYEIISEYGGRGIYSGDSKQLLSIDSGAAFSFLQNHTEMKFSIMKDIVRQSESLKPAIYASLNNQAKQSLSIINSIQNDNIKRDVEFLSAGNVIDKEILKERGIELNVYEYTAKEYSSRDENTRNNTMIVTQLNEDKDKINQSIHNELFNQNKLGNSEHNISVLTPVLTNENDLNRLTFYAKNIGNVVVMNKNYYEIGSIDRASNTITLNNLDDGKELKLEPSKLGEYSDLSLYKLQDLTVSEKDKLLINRTNQDKGFVANSEWDISKIDNNIMHLVDGDGNKKIINLENKDELHFTFGYARTVHSSQGADKENVIAYGPIPDMRSFYVSISRAKEHVVFITDELDKWANKIGNIEDRLSATDILEEKKSIKIVSNDETIKKENNRIDPNINLDDVNNKLNNLDTQKESELITKFDEIIIQEKEKIHNADVDHSLKNLDDRNNIVNEFIEKFDNKTITKTIDNQKTIDEKTL